MNIKLLLFFYLFSFSSFLFPSDFTIASYNCGGLPDHYDYIRAVCMHQLAKQRYQENSKEMAQLEHIQNTALKILFSKDANELLAAQIEWESEDYARLFSKLTAHPNEPDSLNQSWRKKSEASLTPYNVRPISLFDPKVQEMLSNQIQDITHAQYIDFSLPDALNQHLNETRQIMATRIFRNDVNQDIIALQEADYLEKRLFPSYYHVEFSTTEHSKTALAWNKEKFEQINLNRNVANRGILVELLDKKSEKTIAIASCHLSGCNPFKIELNSTTGSPDSKKGDLELMQILEALESCDADIKILAMDSNVTATHPRLRQLKDKGYQLDYLNYLYPTCTNPWQVIHTRIDWIAVKSKKLPLHIYNIPVPGVGLNSFQTNISDHRPIAAKLIYE